MIYILVTTSLIEQDFALRQMEYTRGITALQQAVRDLSGVRIILIENNGKRETFLDTFGLDVFYTTNQSIPTTNRGVKEICDVHACIQHYGIQDDDFVVKLTGRYILRLDSPFLRALRTLQPTTQAILRYGSYMSSAPPSPVHDCITGLIGMRCKHISAIPSTDTPDCIEWHWGAKAASLDQTHVIALQYLGLYMCPHRHTYSIY